MVLIRFTSDTIKLDSLGQHLSRDTISCRVTVYVPESSSELQRFAAWLTGRRPELIDPAILASGGGRERKAIFGSTSYWSMITYY